ATDWDPNANYDVVALAVSGTTVYAGGVFSAVGGQTRERIAALDATTGLATTWNPDAIAEVYALAVSGSTVYAGGAFYIPHDPEVNPPSIGGAFRNYIAALDATTGYATGWAPDANGLVTTLAVSGSTV